MVTFGRTMEGIKVSRFQRNMLCSCGSGRKYKLCCLHASRTGSINGLQSVPPKLSVPIHPPLPRQVTPEGEARPVYDPDTLPDFPLHGHFSVTSYSAAFEYSVPLPG